jgi:integrase
MEALRAIKRDRMVLSPLVFCTPAGKSLRTNFGRYWRAVLAKANVPDFRFHDLRHTFASRLAMDGVDLYTVQRAGGWKTGVMVQRYAHLSPDHIRAAVERLACRSTSGANGHQNGHQAPAQTLAGGSAASVSA